MVNLVETKAGREEEEVSEYEEIEANANEGILLSQSLMIQQVFLTSRCEEESQRHNIFHIRCTVNQRVCDVIIDGGSEENIMLQEMVSKLGLKTEKHLAPYKIGWIKRDPV